MGRIHLEPWRQAWGLGARRNGSVVTRGARYPIACKEQGAESNPVRISRGEGIYENAMQHCDHPDSEGGPLGPRSKALPIGLQPEMIQTTTSPSSSTEHTFCKARPVGLQPEMIRTTTSCSSSTKLRVYNVPVKPQLPPCSPTRPDDDNARPSGYRWMRQRCKIQWCDKDSVLTGERHTTACSCPLLQCSSPTTFLATSFTSWLQRSQCLLTFTNRIPRPSSSDCSFHELTDRTVPALSQFGGGVKGCYSSRGIHKEGYDSSKGVLQSCPSTIALQFAAAAASPNYPLQKGSLLRTPAWSRELATASRLHPFPNDKVLPTLSEQQQQKQQKEQEAPNDGNKKKDGPRINFEIKAPVVRLVGATTDEDGKASHEVITRAVALMKSRQLGLDLVEIDPSADPPVCKMFDYSKYKYELKKKEKAARKRQVEKRRVDAVKNVQIGSRTEQRDLELKVKQAAGHLMQGHRVKLMLVFRKGDREECVGVPMLDQALAMLGEVGIVEVAPKDVGHNWMVVLRPKGAASSTSGG